MAFATSNVQKDYFGSLKVTRGDWSSAVGDAAGSIGVEGGRVYFASFTDQDGTGPYQVSVPFGVTTSGNVSTLSVGSNGTVTTGRFIIIHG